MMLTTPIIEVHFAPACRLQLEPRRGALAIRLDVDLDSNAWILLPNSD